MSSEIFIIIVSVKYRQNNCQLGCGCETVGCDAGEAWNVEKAEYIVRQMRDKPIHWRIKGRMDMDMDYGHESDCRKTIGLSLGYNTFGSKQKWYHTLIRKMS